MPLIRYEKRKFQPAALQTIMRANEIIGIYQADGYDLTLRQLYYQFVSRGLIENKQSEYKRLGSIVSAARRAGLIDWNAIVDRTRNLERWLNYDSPTQAIGKVAEHYARNLWEDQEVYVELWFEKDALIGVFERAAQRYSIPYFSCRGYTSDSEVWRAGQRMRKQAGDKRIVVLHFGDHDPSGIDMTRDIKDRLYLFSHYSDIEVRRLALNMNQVREYNPPPNPAKEADTRFMVYQQKYGDESWELDALEPQVLADLVNDELERDIIDLEAWGKSENVEQKERAELTNIVLHYDSVRKHIKRLAK